jgi:hypothetical protein
MPSEELLDKGLTDAKQGGNGALGAEPLITGAKNLLSQVQGIGFHAHEHTQLLPYRQARTAIKSYFAAGDVIVGIGPFRAGRYKK